MRVLIIDDEASIRKTTEIALQAMGHETALAPDGAIAKKLLQKEDFDVALLDLKLGFESGLGLLPELLKIEPGLAVIVFTAYASIETAVDAIKNGAQDYIPKPFTPDQILQAFKKIEKMKRLEGRVVELESSLSAVSPVIGFETTEPTMQKLYEMADKAAGTPATIMLEGESGTGKSALARLIHQKSPQRDKAFVTVNCPSLSRELLESELFGHVKGAFTGAVGDTVGKVAAADGGTLFLDEIGEMPLDLQPKLLRLLQDREYERVGDPKTRRANVRIIAATNRDLSQAVKDGKFREDLYYRLNVMVLHMPPLRERMGDLEVVAESHLRFFATQMGKKTKGFSPEAAKMLRQYSWPGNLRELRNAIERAVILAADEHIQSSDFPDHLGAHGGQEASNIQVGALVSLEEIEKEHIRRVLSRTHTQEEAANVMGIDPATLYRKRKKYEF